MTIRVKKYECIPDFRWFITGIRETIDDREARFAILKLPSYQWRYRYHDDGMGWHQAWIVYDGHRGFSLEWVATEPQSAGREE